MTDAILPYPWQHPTYDRDKMDDPRERVTFCLERVQEAKQSGLSNVAEAWQREAFTDIRALLDAHDAQAAELTRLEAMRQEFEVRDAVAAKLYPHIERLRTFVAESGARGDFVEQAAANLIEQQAARIAALEDDLRLIAVSAWHKTGEQEYRCNVCGGIGAYPRSIDHRSECAVRRALGD